MSFAVIIPARLGSTRLPNKPLADIGGKPMIVRTAERAVQSGAAQVIVATDHPEIMAVCLDYGIAACLTRADHVSGTDRIAEVAAGLALPLDTVIVNVQGDEPMIDPALIKATAKLINAHTPMATAAYPIETVADLFNPHVVKVVLNRVQQAMYFSRAPVPWHRDSFSLSPQQLPQDYQYWRHIGLYAYSKEFLQTYSTLAVSPLEQLEALEQLRVLWHGYIIAVHLATVGPNVGVDTSEDLERVRDFFRDSGLR